MLMVYNQHLPLRILEEIRLWKLHEKRHTLLLRQLIPNFEQPYTKLLTDWENIFTKMEGSSQRWIDSLLKTSSVDREELHSQLYSFMKHCISQSQEFVRHCYLLSENSRAIADTPTTTCAIQHVIDVSDYFIGICNAAIASKALPASSTPIPAQNSPTTNSLSVKMNPRNESNSSPLTSTSEGTWSEPLSQRPVPIGEHVLPPLPYAYDALEPHIDEQTMRLHHDTHHRSYVEGLNKAEQQMERARNENNYELIKHWQREASFNGAGHYLHTIFWNIMSPTGGGKAKGPIAAQINKDFGSFEQFKQHFSNATEKVEGGGWAILVWSPRSHRLGILQAEKHQNLSQWDVVPLLVLDVWEHAYYLNYQADRKKYIQAWWNLVNWSQVNERFSKARMLKWPAY